MRTIIVDDERWMLKRFETECGAISDVQLVGSFRSALKALEFVRENRVELAFLDIEMPDMTGIELAGRLRQLWPGIVIIFVSAYEQYMSQAFRTQLADYYILKPYNGVDIESAVARARLLSGRQRKPVFIRTFGRFDVFVDDKPLPFEDAKEKELLALLVSAMSGTVDLREAAKDLWPDRADGAEADARRLLSNLQSTLRAAGLGGMLEQNEQGAFFRRDSADCDLFSYKDGDMSALRRFDGGYMEGYGWAAEERRRLTSQSALLAGYRDIPSNTLYACVRCACDAPLTITYANAAFFKITGYTRDTLAQALGNSLRAVIRREDFPRADFQDAADLAKALSDAELRLVDSAGGETWVMCKSAASRGGGEVECLFIDITRLKTRQNLLEEEAQKDALTGLYNRGAAVERIKRQIAEREAGEVAALILMDVDNFKAVNDTYGHPFADTVLTDIAAVLRRSFRSGDIVCRLGGDEMLVYLINIGGERQAREKLTQARDSLAARLKAKTPQGELSCSFGVAMCPGDAEDYLALYQAADLALYAAKKAKGCAVFFSQMEKKQGG